MGGGWCVVCGAWCVVRGAWCVVRGAWRARRGKGGRIASFPLPHGPKSAVVVVLV